MSKMDVGRGFRAGEWTEEAGDDLHLIVVGQLIGNRGSEDGAPHIVVEVIIQQVKSAQ